MVYNIGKLYDENKGIFSFDGSNEKIGISLIEISKLSPDDIENLVKEITFKYKDLFTNFEQYLNRENGRSFILSPVIVGYNK